MKPCKISIVVAVYNTAPYLRKCLEQIVNQTLTPEDYEIIIVNDGSGDDSLKIIRDYASKYSNITVIDKQNEGTFWCRMDGMSKADGEYIGFIDSDDLPQKDMFEKMYAAAKAHDADIVECGLVNEEAVGMENSVLDREEYDADAILEFFVQRRISAALWRRIYRKELVEGVLSFYANPGIRHKDYIGIRNEDEFIFPMLLSRAEKYCVIRDKLYWYREDSAGSIMGEVDQDGAKRLFHVSALLKAGETLLADAGQNDRLKAKFWRMQTDNLFYGIGVMEKYDCYNKINLFEDFYNRHNRVKIDRRYLTAGNYMRNWQLKIKWNLKKRMHK